MKKLLVGVATLTVAVLMSQSLVPQSAAAQGKSSYCNLTKSQRNPVSWNERYGCFDKERAEAARARAEAPPLRKARVRDPYCDLAKSQRNPVAWNARYNCLNR
jgi:hypothetical protein